MANGYPLLFSHKGSRLALFLGLILFTLIPALWAVFPPPLSAGSLAGWQFTHPLPQGNDLNGVYALDETHLIAVGDHGAIVQYAVGGDATAMNQNTSLNFHGTWGSAKNDWFAVGEKGLIMHYDGQAWTPMNSGVTVDLNDVWGSDSSNVFAVGKSGTIVHYDGTSWSNMAAVTTQDLNCVSGTGPYDVYFGGDSGTILHYDGVFITPMATRRG